MQVILTTPYYIKFDLYTIDKLYSYVLKNSNEWPNDNMVYMEGAVEKFYNIKLDYDEENNLYIIYFETEGDMTMFKLKYSELL